MSTPTTQEETKLLNETLFEKLASTDPGMNKQAVDAVNDYTRTKIREDGFYRRIMPPLPISNEANADSPCAASEEALFSCDEFAARYSSLKNSYLSTI